MRKSILFLFIICYLPSFASELQKIPFKLGAEEISIEVYKNNFQEGRVFVHVHENEEASLEAGLKFIEKYGGKLVTIKHSKKGVNRNIAFEIKGEKFFFDPNRIYSADEKVLRFSLKTEEKKPKYFEEALSEVKALSSTIWDQVKDASYIVSLHNNKNECSKCVKKGWFGFRFIEESYNLTSYVKTCDVASESSLSAEEIYINPSINNSEFFIVTQKKDFDYLTNKKMNVVLQNNNPIDDGSMSVWAVKNKMRYMNAEAKHGKVMDQDKMLALIIDLN
jgi:hypothetical protein